jgi:Tol biopolymer transport system component
MMALAAGEKLGPYAITGSIGAGGMGEVYRASDTKLGRDVALKVLPEAVAADAERMARFEREAKVLALLSHPNVAAIYGFEDSGGVHALVMELVEGPTLADRIAQGPFPIDEALPIARQLADALEYAHERGIVHRDLKPANIKVSREDSVKILDFGLAKAVQGEAVKADIADSPTISRMATQAGVILGTAAYMSPEQAKGKPVDRRADIWAFGCVLYEMLTGKHAFAGESVAETLSAVLRNDPDWSLLPNGALPPIRGLIRRCLTKDPKQRLRDIGDARITIEEAILGVGERSALPRKGEALLYDTTGDQRSPLRRALPWAAGALAALVALTATWLLMSRQRPAARMQFAIPLESEVSNLALSADGQMLALVGRDDTTGKDMLYFESLGAAGATRLNGTEGASYPFWSPDNTFIGFFAGGKLKKVSVSGGDPQVLASASYARGGAWSSRGVIIYAPETGGRLWRVNADGSEAAPLSEKLFRPGESSHRWPVFLPDGDHFLFWAGSFVGKESETKSGIYLSSLAAEEKKLIVLAKSNPGYADGNLYYVDNRRNLLAVSLKVTSGEIAGEPAVVSDHVTFQPSVYYCAFSAGGKNTVVYSTSAGAGLSALTWYDHDGRELGRVAEPGVIANPSISPDGRRATMDVADLKNANIDVWTEDLDRNASSRFTFDPAEDATGVWSRDGQKIAYRSIVGGSSSALEVKKSTGLEAQQQVYVAPGVDDDVMPNSWSLDDRKILCSYQLATGGSNLVVVDVTTGEITPFLATQASETNGQISPDGKWVAYVSNESGDWEIYVTTFPNAQGKWQVSLGGGTEPRWRGDSRGLYFIDSKGVLAAVPVNVRGTFSAGTPSRLFPLHGRPPISSTDFFSYDVSRDRERFLVNRYVKPDHVEPLTVVLNATATTKK